MSNIRPKSSQSDTSAIKKDDTPSDNNAIKSLRKPSQLIPPRTKVPKQDNRGSLLSTDSSKNGEDTISISSRRQAGKSLSMDANKNARGPSLRTSSMIGYNSNQKRVLENQFNNKKLRFISLKREIEDKQRSSETAYDELYQLREKILANGGKDPGKIEDLVPILSFPTRIRLDGDSAENVSNDDCIGQFQAAFKQIPDTILAFCREVLEKRTELSNWMLEMDARFDEYPTINFKEELGNQLELYKSDTAELQERMATIEREQVHQVTSLTQRVSCMYQELRLLKQRQEARLEGGASVTEEELAPAPAPTGVSGLISGSSDVVEDLNKELKAEKEKLLKARSKIREQRSYISQIEAKMQAEIDRSKHLEAQLKLKESSIMLKAKELNKHHTRNDVAFNKLEKQKETVEARVAKLKEELELRENEAKTLLSEYNKQIEDLQKELDNERKAKADMSAQLDEFMQKYNKLEDKCKQLLEMHESKRKEALSDGNHTENELQLFNELKETQRLLAEKDELIQRLQIEREEIITAVNEADQENDSSNQKLTAELLKKSNELHTVKSQFAQLQKNYKRLQYKSDQLEHKLEDMSRVQAQMKDGSRAAYGAQIMQLQTQVSDLRASLAEATSLNSDLEKTVTQLQLKLEHYKRYIRDIGKDMKVRKEMYQILGNKEVDDMIDPKKLGQINEEFEKLYGLVEIKDGQVRKLEKIITQMEKQEEYSQAQRTRLEQRIGKLETALKEGQQAHRYVMERPQQHSVSYDIETYHTMDQVPSPVARAHREVTRCNACPNYVKARVAAYSSSGCSSDLVRRNASIERFYKLSEYTRRKQAAKRGAGLPVYKWFLKPFFRESSNHVVYNRHLKNIGIVAASRDGAGYHPRHHAERKIRAINHCRETARSYDDPRYYD